MKKENKEMRRLIELIQKLKRKKTTFRSPTPEKADLDGLPGRDLVAQTRLGA